MFRLILKSLKNPNLKFYPFALTIFNTNSENNSNNNCDLELEEAEKKRLFKSQLYFSRKSITEVTDEADRLFDSGQFLEVYELLSRLKFNENVEVQWRICRALFKMSTDQTLKNEIRREMILEAYNLITAIFNLEENNANVYKWMALILDAKTGMDGLDVRVSNYSTVINYLQKAVELNPEDPVTLHILGNWYYEMSNLTFLQRWLARVFYGVIPSTTFEEAYEYLLKSSEVHQDNYYIPTLYMLGKTCIRLNQIVRATYYLHTAATLPPRTKFEIQCAKGAGVILKRLELLHIQQNQFVS